MTDWCGDGSAATTAVRALISSSFPLSLHGVTMTSGRQRQQWSSPVSRPSCQLADTTVDLPRPLLHLLLHWLPSETHEGSTWPSLAAATVWRQVVLMFKFNFNFTSWQWRRRRVFPPRSYICLFFHRDRLIPQCFMNHLNSFDKTDGEYSQVLTDYLIRFWGERQGHSRLTRWQRHPCRRWGVRVYHLVLCVLAVLMLWSTWPGFIPTVTSCARRKRPTLLVNVSDPYTWKCAALKGIVVFIGLLYH